MQAQQKPNKRGFACLTSPSTEYSFPASAQEPPFSTISLLEFWTGAETAFTLQTDLSDT